MNRNFAKATATAAVGIAIAAGTLAFTGQGSELDSLPSAAASDFDRAPLRFNASAATASASVQVDADIDEVAAEYAGRRGRQLAQGAASSASSASSDAAQGRELDLDLQLGQHDTHCTRVAVMDLTIGAALACGLDAANWATNTANDTYRQARGNVEVLTDAANQVVTDVKDETVETVDAVTEVVSEVVSDTVETTRCIAAAGQDVLDTSARDLVNCA